uniref:SFRICE_014571 n=1 Tax=Spodoptera frugiperda TaxID=7108 RepID=A0A2H1V7T9_SPOFR
MPQTGATRRQKFLKSEKSKTKLKGKNKELPKGTNVTKTNFKVKKIVLREQLKKHGETEALSTRKLSIKELLSRLNHFNTHSRTEALNGIKELIELHPEVLETNLGELVHGVTPLVLNIEKVVRHESLKTLHVILSKANIERIDPFFDIMCTYLRSAMTHIDGRIQEDSLLFLDTLLLCTPVKVAQDFHKIIPNFLDMISKLRVDSKPGRTLTVNLGSQITSVKWRVKVLHRLKDYLQEFVKYNKIQDYEGPVIDTTKIFDASKMNHYSLFNPSYIQKCPLSCFSSKNLQETVPLDEVEKFREYTDTLMPLLFETWLEVCPNISSEKNIETVVSEDAAALLNHTLDVISLIWSLVKHFNIKSPSSNIQNTFSQKYRKPYLQHFVNAFPYVTNIRTKQRNVSSSEFENTITDPKLVAQNLVICELFILLNPNINVKNQNKDVLSVLKYIEKTFNKNTQAEINDIIIKILHTIFSNEVNNWTRNISVMNDLFQKIVWAYFNKELPSSFRQKIFSLLCKIALNDKLGHFHDCDAYNTWVKNLPDILLEKTVEVQTVDIIHKFAVRNNKTFNSVVRPKLLEIVQNLPNIIISDVDSNQSSYYKLFSLLYYVKKWDDETLNLLRDQIINSVYKSDYNNYIFETLKLKSGEM